MKTLFMILTTGLLILTQLMGSISRLDAAEGPWPDELDLKAEATKLEADIILRISSYQPYIGGGANYLIKVAIQVEDPAVDQSDFKSKIFIRIKQSNGEAVEKSRDMSYAEMEYILSLVSEQEVFSLPEKREDIYGLVNLPPLDSPSIKLEQYILKSDRRNVVGRISMENTPVNKVAEGFGKLAENIISEVDLKVSK